MMSRVALPVGVLVVSVPLVRAATLPTEEPSPNCIPKTLKPSQLSLYDEPVTPKLVYIPAPETTYTQAVSTVRKAVWEVTVGMQGFIDAAKTTYNVGKDYLKEAKTHVQEDSSGLQRAGLITIAGFGGIVAGYRGGIIRKAILGSAAMTTAAAVCYPNQAVDISSTGLNRLKEEALTLWEQMSPASMHKQSPARGANKPKVTKTENPSSDVQIMIEKSASTPAVSPNEDPGQSRPEDKDLYASRT